MDVLENSQQPKEDKEDKEDFFDEIKFWINKTKFDTPLKYIFFPLYFIGIVCTIIFFANIDIYIEGSQYLTDLMAFAIFFYALYLGKVIPRRFQSLINENRKYLVF